MGFLPYAGKKPLSRVQTLRRCSLLLCELCRGLGRTTPAPGLTWKAHCNSPPYSIRALTFPVCFDSELDGRRGEREGARGLQLAGLRGRGEAEREEEELHGRCRCALTPLQLGVRSCDARCSVGLKSWGMGNGGMWSNGGIVMGGFRAPLSNV